MTKYPGCMHIHWKWSDLTEVHTHTHTHTHKQTHTHTRYNLFPPPPTPIAALHPPIPNNLYQKLMELQDNKIHNIITGS